MSCVAVCFRWGGLEFNDTHVINPGKRFSFSPLREEAADLGLWVGLPLKDRASVQGARNRCFTLCCLCVCFFFPKLKTSAPRSL